jgi:hypothetical protein
MASGRSAVSSQGINIRYLPIARLVLAGFVVDAGPFFRWFKPIRLRNIEFKHGCIDAGFALPSPMSNSVTVTWPGKPPPRDKIITVTRVDPQNVKRVRLKRKSSLRGSETSGIKPKTISVMTKTWLPSARRYSWKVRGTSKERQQQEIQTSRATSTSDPSSFRQKTTSVISWTSRNFVVL